MKFYFAHAFERVYVGGRFLEKASPKPPVKTFVKKIFCGSEYLGPLPQRPISESVREFRSSHHKNYSAAIALPILLLSGVLTALPLVVPQLWFLSWVSMIPLIYLSITAAPHVTKRGKTSRKFIYLYGLAFSFGYYFVLYYWFVCLYPLDFVGMSNAMSVLTIAVAWVGMTLLQSSTTALVPLFLRLLCRDRATIAMPLISACLWTLFEWSQTLTWAGVPWGRLALSQYTNIRMIQSASLLGSLFIGFMIVAVNALFALVLIRLTSDFDSQGRREAESVKDGANPLSEDNLQEKTFEQKFLKGAWG